MQSSSSSVVASALPLMKILKVCGLWPWIPTKPAPTTKKTDDDDDDAESLASWTTQRVVRLQMFYRYLLQIPLSFVCIALMWIEVIRSQDLSQAGDVLYISFTETAFLVKIFNIWLLGTKASAYMEEIGNDAVYELCNRKECDFWHREQKMFQRISVVYIGGSVAVGIFAFVGVVLLHGYELPFALWVPFDWQHNARNYWLLYVYEIFAVHLTCISNTTLDMIQCYFLFHVALLYKLIGLRLRELQNFNEKEVLQQLQQIFQLQRNARRLTQQCEELTSAPILAQIIFSALVLCFTGYRLQNLNFTEDTGRFFAMLQFLSVMALQIFLPCYFANEITINANELTTCVYSSNWHRFSVPTRKIICLYMEFLKKPVHIKAGGFFEVGLPIFSKTMNNAYSFFAILLNMEK